MVGYLRFTSEHYRIFSFHTAGDLGSDIPAKLSNLSESEKLRLKEKDFVVLKIINKYVEASRASIAGSQSNSQPDTSVAPAKK